MRDRQALVLDLKLKTLEGIARGETLATLADRICRKIEARFPDTTCSLLTVDSGGILHPVAGPSLPGTYLAMLENIAAGPCVGSCGTAAYTGHAVEVGDITSDPRWENWRAPALALGFRACSSFPLVDASGLVVATLALYYRTAGRLASEEECAMVRTALHLCDLALARDGRAQEHRAALDALTGLPGRGSFNSALANIARTGHEKWALLLVDVDDLKVTNDTFGHAAGDRLLQDMAGRLQRLASPDRAFRIGGDEFAVIVLAPERVAAPESLATRLLAGLAGAIDFGTFSLTPAATIGCATANAATPDTQAVFRQADMALHHAKETCPGHFVRFEPAIRSGIAARLSSIESVECALREERIEAWYQPIVDIASRHILGFEALCRMRTPEGEVIPAAVFSQATSDARIASTLTAHMLAQVAGQMRRWRDMGIGLLPVSVNITAPDLRGGKLPDLIDRLFGRDRELLTHLIFEIHETLYFGKRTQETIAVIETLREQGIRIALDDFGTGYASLTHLRTMPIDILKIDKSFISGLPDDEVSGAIVSAISGIARKLGAHTTAEGVETLAQARMLGELGTISCQGFLYAPALPGPEATRLAMLHGTQRAHAAPMPLASHATPARQPAAGAERKTGTHG